MKVQFVDSHYLLALINTRDQDHAAAVRHSQGNVSRLVTTTWVLVEVADALSAVGSRIRTARFLRSFQAEPYVEVVPPSANQFNAALDLYQQRPDKDWSLTDCLSFRLMQERGIAEALTADHHFEQAGYIALLRNTP